MTWPGAWPTHEMVEGRRRLLQLRTMLGSLPLDDVSAELARFLVVRATGYVEQTFESCLQHFAEEKSHPAVARHVVGGLFHGKNPKSDTLIMRLRSFDEVWATSFGDYLADDDNRAQRELDYMVDRRNRIAHGGSESVNMRKALDLADIAVEIGERLITLLDPH